MVVREDLTPPQQICQAVHAAYESGIRYGNKESVSSVVVVTVPNEEELIRTKERLDRKRIDSYIFKEPDLGDQATALATEPLERARKKHFYGYPLWKSVSKVQI